MAYDKETAEENLSKPVEIKLRNRKDWEEAPDLQAFVEWATNSRDEDFLMLPDADAIDYRQQLV